MKKNLFSLLAAVLVTTQLIGQHFTQVILPPGLGVTVGEKQVYRDNLYMVLKELDAPDTEYLYRYNGASFTRIALPAEYATIYLHQFEAFNDKLYMILKRDSEYDLFSYDGAFHRVDIPFPALKINPYDHMVVHQDHLYLGLFDPLTTDFYWVRFDGETGFDLIVLPENFSPSIGTDKLVYDDKIFTLAAYQKNLTIPFMSCDSTDFRFHPLPDPDHFLPFSGGDMEVYNGYLYMPYFERDDGYNIVREGFLKFDGTAFTFINDLPRGTLPIASPLQSFNGKLFMNLNTASGDYQWHSFDDSLFQRIPFPPEVVYGGVFSPCVFECNLYLNLNTGSGGANALYTYGPAAGCEVFGLPARFRDYDQIDLRTYAVERPWCWTGIDISWIITPVCPTPPLCPPIPVQTTLSDKYGKLVWSKSFNEPFQINFPPADQPLQLSVEIENDKVPEKVLEMDESLVANGIEEFRMNIIPAKEEFNLSVKTSKDKDVPFTMTLVNASGKTIWQENFIAPLDKSIKPRSSEPGALLKISATETISLESKGISEVKYYPNPVDGKLTLEVKTFDEKVPFEVLVTDLKGNKVFHKQFVAPVQEVLDFTSVPTGLYTFILSVDDAVLQDLIEVK